MIIIFYPHIRSVNEKTNAKENRNTNDSFSIKMRFEVYYKKLIWKKHEGLEVYYKGNQYGKR